MNLENPTSTASTRSGLSADRPFPGLRPYYLEDHDYFFGREDQIYALYRLFDHSRFVAVVGSSGSGKSSLVRAGLLPLIEKESSEPTGRIWKVIQMHPGDTPIGNLAAAMARTFFPREDANIAAARQERIKFALRRSSFGMSEALHEIEGLGDTSIILVVDQFEELFRYAARRQEAEPQRHEEATQFVQVLLAASRDRALNVYIMLTMRSDFIGDCANFRGLPEAVSASQFLVPSLTRDQREDAIRRPIENACATIEPELVERLLNDGGDDIDQLPVLQHCLSRLWDLAGRDAATGAGRRRNLHMDHYREVGGIAHALSQHADEILKDLSGTELAVEQTFRSLAEIDSEGRIVRRACFFKDLRAETGMTEQDLRTVVDRFRNDDCSFLTPSKFETANLTDETRIDVGHEALLRRWERVSGDPLTGSQQTGWIRAEESDGRDYRVLLLMAESEAGRIPPDQVESRLKWWRQRRHTAAWARRYGGHVEAVERLFQESLAAVQAEAARRETEHAAEQRRIDLEAQAARSHEEAEKARLELEAQSARGRERLARRTMLAVSAVLCVTIGLGVFSYLQWQTALQQKANAEQSLKIGGELTRGLLDKIQQFLDTGSVSVEVAKDLLNAAQSGLVQLENVAQTPATLAMRANLLVGFADLYATLQDNKSALQFSQQAQTVATQLVKQDPDSSDNQYLLYSADFRIGDAQSDQSNFTAGLQAYKDALEIAQNLAAKNPANQQEVAFVQVKIADIYKERGSADQALPLYQSALSIDQGLAQQNPNVDSLQRDVATALTRIGDLQKDSKDLPGALTSFQSALDIRTKLANKIPTDATLQSNLSVAYNRVAEVFMRQGKFDDALALYNSALGIRKTLAHNDPTYVAWQSALAFEYVDIGDLSMKKPDFAGAADSYRQSLAIRDKLVAQGSSNPTWEKNLADSHSRLAEALLNQGQLAEALAERKAALVLRLNVSKQSPNISTRQRELIEEYIATGDLLRQQDDTADATANYQNALNVISDFVAKHPGSKSLETEQDKATQRIEVLQPVKSP
jgi:tetratricopeptide (TPR) repeat protein/energy-coupling factor transporter ATP-binding protein EcfA2